MEYDFFSRRDLMLKPGTGELIKNCPVAVFGVGALGNAVLLNLVLQGFSKFLVVDMDVVEDSNLSKSPLFFAADIGKPKAEVAANALRRMALADDVEVEYINGNIITDVGKSVFWDYKVIVCAVDTMDCRAYINDWCVRSGTPLLVEGGFSGRFGDVSFFAPNADGKCLHCLRQLIGQGSFDGKRNSCSGLRVKDAALDIIPVIQTTSSIAGAYIAQEIVKYLEGTATLLNKTLFFNGNSLVNSIFAHGDCGGCPLKEEASMELYELTLPADATVRQVLEAANGNFGTEQMLVLPDTYVISGHCHRCGALMNIEKRKDLMWDNERWCLQCRSTESYETALNHSSQWKEVRELTLQSDEEFLGRKLSQLGVPKDDILQLVSSADGDIRCRYVRIREEKAVSKFVISSSSCLEPFPVEKGADAYYNDPEDSHLDKEHLAQVIEAILSDTLKLDGNDGYHCFIEHGAMGEFLSFAIDVYNTTGNEATGVFAGYWLADGKDNRYAYCTHFLPAYGDGSPTTCTIEPEDYGRFSSFCRERKLTQLVWVHSHPGFGAFFSSTDDATLRTLYLAPQYMGIVVDIISGDTAGYKMSGGTRCEHTFQIVDSKLEVEV